MTAEHLLSAYIDTHVVLVIVAVTWFGLKRVLARSPLRTAYLTQLRLLYSLLALVVLAPLLIVGMDMSQSSSLLAGQSGLRLSDFLVSQYLSGNIALAPTTFENLLMLRTETIHAAVSLSGWFSYSIVGVLGAGVLWVMGRNARETWQLTQMIRRSYVLRRIGKVEVRFTDETRVPFSTRSFFRYYVVLPTSLLAQSNDVRVAVSHEVQHVRQGDLTWEVVLETIRAAFFWNPAFGYCKRDVERLRELACDQQVLSRNTLDVRAYCECLLRVCRSSLSGRRDDLIMTPSVPFVQIDRRFRASHSASFLRQRVVSMLDKPTVVSSKRFAPVLAVSLAVLVLSATVALRPTNDWSHDRLMLSTIVNLERLNSRSTTP